MVQKMTKTKKMIDLILPRNYPKLTKITKNWPKMTKKDQM